MIDGHKSSEAIKILFTEISNRVDLYKLRVKDKCWKQVLRECGLSVDNSFSTYHWTSLAISIIALISLSIGYSFQINSYKDPWILVECIFIIICMISNIIIISWENDLQRNEALNKITRFLNMLKNANISEKYLDLNNPISQCTSLQWTYRDSKVVNLPLGLLVKGDIILMRPGQVVPAKCKKYETKDIPSENENINLVVDREIYETKEMYHPTSPKPVQCPTSSSILFSRPLKPQPFLLLETPIISNIESILNSSVIKRYSKLDLQRFYIFSTLIERILLPIIWGVGIIILLIRYLIHPHLIGTWSEMFLIIPAEVVFPLLSLTFPLMWRLFDTLGIAKVILFAEHYVPDKSQEATMSLISLNSDTNIERNTEFLFNLSGLLKEWLNIAAGRCNSLPRTCNLLQSLGNVTSFSCVDKKGIISWPNPTAEKLFFFTRLAAVEQKPELDEVENAEIVRRDSSLKRNHLKNREKNTKLKKSDWSTGESQVHVLDLTYDVRYHYNLKFDEKSWGRYLASLKPLGLSILLNTCNLHTVESYTQFADHVTCKSLKNMETVPVVNRRCFCQLAKQVGFKMSATSIFQTDCTYGIYQNPIKSEKDVKSNVVMPMSNMFCVVVKEMVTNSRQIFCQGTADIVMGACTMYWDGEQLRRLSDAEKKKILDFYHRTSISSYCTAFAYRPITEPGLHLPADTYVEIINEMTMARHIPAFRSNTIDAPNNSIPDHFLPPGYHGSAESLVMHKHSDSNACEQIARNYIFLGMITMQYQAKQEIIELIESLESSCIRFVHFSRENELRSRVFSEKMGLEAGWNCHISLLMQDPSSESKSDSSIQTRKMKDNREADYVTDTGAIDNLTGGAPNKFSVGENSALNTFGRKFISSPNIVYDELKPWSSGINTKTPLLSNNPTRRQKPEYDQQSSRVSTNSIHQGQGHPSCHGNPGQRMSIHSVTNNKSLLNHSNSLAHSSLSSYLDSFSDFNRALLPKGINNIRPHLVNVDNVPLQVSLFTDCTPTTTCEMMEILQEYGEVTCCLGSSSNIDNTQIFLQANCSIAIEPVHPYICINLSERNLVGENTAPSVPINMLMDFCTGDVSTYKLHSLLLSLPSSLLINSRCFPAISQITSLARHHCYHMMSCLHLFVSLQIYLSLHQFLSLPLLPPPIPSWFVFVASVGLIPGLSASMLANSVDSNVARGVQERHTIKLTRKLFIYCVYYLLKILPNILICVFTQIIMLYNFCVSANPDTLLLVNSSFYNSTIYSDTTSNDTLNPLTCHFLYGVLLRNDTREGSWNNLYDDENRLQLSTSQNIISLQITIFFGIFSLCFAHRLQHLWSHNPLKNKFLLFVLVFVLVCVCSAFPYLFVSRIFYIRQIPVYVWIVLVLSIPFNFTLLEAVKHNEIKTWIRHQKRVRLDFGTKLGMNSPF